MKNRTNYKIHKEKKMSVSKNQILVFFEIK